MWQMTLINQQVIYIKRYSTKEISISFNNRHMADVVMRKPVINRWRVNQRTDQPTNPRIELPRKEWNSDGLDFFLRHGFLRHRLESELDVGSLHRRPACRSRPRLSGDHAAASGMHRRVLLRRSLPASQFGGGDFQRRRSYNLLVQNGGNSTERWKKIQGYYDNQCLRPRYQVSWVFWEFVTRSGLSHPL